MNTCVKNHEGLVLAEATPTPGVLRCTAVMAAGEERRRCVVLIQRTGDGGLVDGVRAHYKTCHPERNLR